MIPWQVARRRGIELVGWDDLPCRGRENSAHGANFPRCGLGRAVDFERRCLKDRPIRVNAISSGPLDTPGLSGWPRPSRRRNSSSPAWRGSSRAAKRLQAVILNSEGRTAGELSEILKAPRSKVPEWLGRCEQHGVEGLLEGYRCGRRALLSQAQRTQLGDILDSGPVAYGLDRGIWASPMNTWVIEEEFGVSYRPGDVRKLLHAMDFSVQRPRRVLARADRAAQERWQRRTYPNLKTKPAARTAL
jgi:transposase